MRYIARTRRICRGLLQGSWWVARIRRCLARPLRTPSSTCPPTKTALFLLGIVTLVPSGLAVCGAAFPSNDMARRRRRQSMTAGDPRDRYFHSRTRQIHVECGWAHSIAILTPLQCSHVKFVPGLAQKALIIQQLQISVCHVAQPHSQIGSWQGFQDCV